ncbi:MAG TPA: PAS domain S-box protein [Candidatus Binatia bacterium]
MFTMPDSPAARVPLRVLLVEDSEADAELLLEELRRGGYEPTWERVDTAATLVAALQRQTWEVITCDWVMPQFSAPVAFQLLKDHGVDVPIIIVSGEVGEEFAVTAMKAGARDFVSKRKLMRLCPAIERELQEAQMRLARKQAEEALRESEEHFRSVVENASDMIVILDREGIMRYTNPAHDRVLGYQSEDLVGMSAFALIHPDDLPAASEVFAQGFRNPGTTFTAELRDRHKDGSWRFFESAGKLPSDCWRSEGTRSPWPTTAARHWPFSKRKSSTSY